MARMVVLLLSACGLAACAHAGTPSAPAPRTGQTTCYDAAGLPAACAGTGQDAETRRGVAWPEPRFAGNGDRTVTDRLTRLTWTIDADPAGGLMTWRQALDSIKALNGRNHLGHSDWRLPNVNEMESLAARGPDPVGWLAANGFRNVRGDEYWTSSTYAAHPGHAWTVSVSNGIGASRGKDESGGVWPVRGDRTGASPIPKTGQDTCHDAAGRALSCAGTGQDGESRSGAAWPEPRFAQDAPGTLTDRLTGLVWTEDGTAPGPAECGSGAAKTWHGALDHVRCLNAARYLGRSDWRLPNRNELASLVDRGRADVAAWLAAQGFSNVRADGYWSSTVYAYSPWNAWSVNMRDGASTPRAIGHSINVWPVRGGPQGGE